MQPEARNPTRRSSAHLQRHSDDGTSDDTDTDPPSGNHIADGQAGFGVCPCGGIGSGIGELFVWVGDVGVVFVWKVGICCICQPALYT